MQKADRLGAEPDATRRGELEARFLSALPEVESAVRCVARRYALSADEREEFASEVKLALIERDYAVLARFQGRSSLFTYLVTVVQRLFLDRQRKLWGKWRPSAQATRLGPVAERLEVLIHRDGTAPVEAVRRVRAEAEATESEEALLALAARLPARQRTRIDAVGGSAEITDLAGARAGSEALDPHRLLDGAESAGRCQAAVEQALAALAPEDRLLLRLRFEDDLSVADIARLAGHDQKRLYRRIETLLKDLGHALRAHGVEWDQIRTLMDAGQCHLRLTTGKEAGVPGAEKRPARPSTLEATP